MDGMNTPAGNPVAQRVARAALAAAVVALGAYTLWGFMPALVWAVIFAISLWPWYRRLQQRVGHRCHDVLLPMLFTLGVALVFIVPLGLVGVQLAHESHQAMDWMRDARANGIAEPDFLHRLPVGADAVSAWWQQNLADPGSAAALLDRFSHDNAMNYSRHLSEIVLRRVTLFAFTLVALFFLFRDGPLLAEQMRRASLRSFGPSGERISRQIIASIHGTIDGLVLVGLGEGFVLGVAYAVAGVPHAAVFGAFTAIAAMIPFAAPVVFGLAALLLAAQGSVVSAVVVLALGMTVTFTADHFIRPVLIGGATKLPFLWVLLGILGGVEVWGLLGLFLGPAIMAVLILLWREWVGGGDGKSAAAVREPALLHPAGIVREAGPTPV